MGQESVESVEIRCWHVDCVEVRCRRPDADGESLGSGRDRGDRGIAAGQAEPNGLLDDLQREAGEELQDADVVAGTGAEAMMIFEMSAKLGERGRQLPVAVDRGMVQRRWLRLQNHQEVQRIEHPLVPFVTPSVGGDDAVVGDDLDAVDETLDGCRAEGVAPRHTVSVAVEADGLVLVHAAGGNDARLEGPGSHGQGCCSVAVEANVDGLVIRAAVPFPSLQATSSQVLVQLGQVVDLGHRRGPHPFQVLDPVLDSGLLLRRGWQAEFRREEKVRGQGGVSRMQRTVPAPSDVDGHRRRVVPPEFLRHGAEEVERFTQSMEDGLGSFRRQRDCEGRIRDSR